jgi:diguanylate cyclase (GGDEF)-like protein
LARLPKGRHGAAVAATVTLAQLRLQVQQARLELQALRSQLAAMRSEIDTDLGVQLRRANEQLLLATLHAEASAEQALSQLDALAQSSQRDELTNTPNRALLLDRLERAITMAQRRHTRCAVVFLDIDHFKQINDTLGHAAGDAVLQLVARRLGSAVRDSDAVGRQGGDEFLVLLAEVSCLADTVLVAKKLIADMAAPSLVCGHLLQVSVSVGVAIYPDDAHDARTLIGLADAAMYRSKRRGGGSFSFHGDKPAAEGSATAPV